LRSGSGPRGRNDTLRTRAASGPRSSGTMTGPRGARCTGAGEGPPVCTRRFQETRPGAESGVTAWREPRWSAERRARPAGRAAAPEARAGGNICWRGEAPRDSCAFSALRLPLFIRRQQHSWRGAENSGADASRERDRFLTAPATAGRGTTGAREASEPWWWGRRTRRFAIVAGSSRSKN
jgi:hypothetical protein